MQTIVTIFNDKVIPIILFELVCLLRPLISDTQVLLPHVTTQAKAQVPPTPMLATQAQARIFNSLNYIQVPWLVLP